MIPPVATEVIERIRAWRRERRTPALGERGHRAFRYGLRYGYVTAFNLDAHGRLEFSCRPPPGFYASQAWANGLLSELELRSRGELEAWLAGLGPPTEQQLRSGELINMLQADLR
jgi:hypothetical protein